MTTVYKNASVLLDNGFQNDLTITVKDHITQTIGPQSQLNKPNESTQFIDLRGGYLVPGLVDLQVYGTEGNYFGGAPSLEHLAGMESTLMAQGIRGFLATIATNTDEIVLKAIEAARAFKSKGRGAFLGLHLEGPFLNPLKKGAHPAHLIRKASLDEINHWLDLADGAIKMMTIAPELQDEAILKTLRERGVIVSVGHSNATYNEALEFLNKQVSTSTHLFNAMPSLHHREPGLILAIFEQKPYASIIPDGIHVSYPMLALAKRELGEKLFLITDAVASSSTGVYKHQLKNDHYETPEGILSGSAISLLEGVVNCIKHAGIAPEEAFRMASSIPSSVIGMESELGSIRVGGKADFLCLDKNFKLMKDCLTFTS